MIWYLDTNICIDCLRGRSPLIKQMLQVSEPSQIKIPALVKAELLHGAAKSARPGLNKERVELFLAPFEIIAFDDSATTMYAQIRSELEQKGEVIGYNDLIIAATVMAHEGILVSANTDEFSRIKGLRLENWVEISL